MSGRSWKVRGARSVANLQVAPVANGVRITTNATPMGSVEDATLSFDSALKFAGALRDLAVEDHYTRPKERVRKLENDRIRVSPSSLQKKSGSDWFDVYAVSADVLGMTFRLTPKQAVEVAEALKRAVQGPSRPTVRGRRKNPSGLLRHSMPGERVMRGYIEAALWSSTDDDGEPLDAEFSESDFSQDAKEKMSLDVYSFIDQAERAGLDLWSIDPEQIGHDFWLTRNHHGAGFWDRGLGSEGDILTEIAHSFGEVDIYVGDDGELYFSR